MSEFDLEQRIEEYEAKGYFASGTDYSTEERFETAWYIIGLDEKIIPHTDTYDEHDGDASWRLFFELVDSGNYATP